MSHKKIIISIFLILLLSFTIVLASSQDITITSEKVNPQPAEPGKDLTVQLRVWNKANTDKEITIELLEKFPFILKSSHQDFSNKFLICAGCSRENTYFLTIDHQAVSGKYKLNFLVTEDGSGLKRFLEIDVKGEPDLIFEVTNLSGEITPNGEFDVEINLTNKGKGVARDITLNSNSENFLLKGSNVISINQLEVGISKILNIRFLTGSSLKKDVYSIPISLKYAGHTGKSITSLQEISAKVINKAKLSLKEVKIEPPKLTPGDDVTFQIRIENIGDGNAENIKLALESEIEGTKNAYLGRLEKDDDSPVFFTGEIQSSGEKTDSLTISYEDDLGAHTLKEEIKYSVKGVSISTIIISILVLLVVILLGILSVGWVYLRCKCVLKSKKCFHKSHLPPFLQKRLFKK